MATGTLEKIETFEGLIKRRLEILKREQDLGCLDFGLYDVLVSLHKRGFITNYSCAGHCKGKRGDIGFWKREIEGRNREDLITILMRHGLKDIDIETKGKDTTGVSFAAIEGSQYRGGMNDMWPPWEDADYAGYIPPKPEKCETCGGIELWIQGEYYVTDSTIEWMCKKCQPLSFENNDRTFQTPEIMLKRATLPVLKLWKVEIDGKFPFQLRAAIADDIYDELGIAWPSDEYDEVFITRIE